MGGGYNMIRDLVGGFGQEASNPIPAIIQLTILLASVIGFRIVFTARAMFGALFW